MKPRPRATKPSQSLNPAGKTRGKSSQHRNPNADRKGPKS